MPIMTMRTVVDGREETISEYICDWPECPNVAVHAVGVLREVRARAAVCAEHAARISESDLDPSSDRNDRDPTPGN
jgi:hypothetical protein